MSVVLQKGKKKRRSPGQYIRGFFTGQQLTLQLMMVPAMAALIIFHYIPMTGIVISVKEYTLGKGFFDGPFVGVKYFSKALNDRTFWMALRNTVILSTLSLIFSFPMPIILALMFNESSMRHMKKFAQTSSYLPHFFSSVVVAAFWQLLLSSDGVVNEVLARLGLISSPIGFWTDPKYYYGIRIVMSWWSTAGWNAIIYFAAITSVSADVYEAAIVDGAGRMRRIISIILPCILPTIAIKWIMSVSGLFKSSFDMSYLLGNDFNHDISYVLEYFITEKGLSQMKYSYSTAIGQLQALASLIMLALANAISKKVTEVSIF